LAVVSLLVVLVLVVVVVEYSKCPEIEARIPDGHSDIHVDDSLFLLFFYRIHHHRGPDYKA
jgi:hypothetical protein